MTETTTVAEQPAAPSVVDDEVHHLFCCCDENLGLCGTDLTGVPINDDDEVPCPLCYSVEDEPCPRCGCVECPEELP